MHGGVGDCWKRFRVGRTPKCFWNWEVVRVWRMTKVSKVRVGKTLRWLWSRKEVVPWQKLSEANTVTKQPWHVMCMSLSHQLLVLPHLSSCHGLPNPYPHPDQGLSPNPYMTVHTKYCWDPDSLLILGEKGCSHRIHFLVSSYHPLSPCFTLTHPCFTYRSPLISVVIITKQSKQSSQIFYKLKN